MLTYLFVCCPACLILMAPWCYYHFLFLNVYSMFYYLGRRVASGDGIATLGVCVCVCLCLPSRDCTPQCRIILGGEGNALYPVFSSSLLYY